MRKQTDPMPTDTAGTAGAAGAAPIGPTTKPVPTHNQTRFNAYKQVATEFVDGEAYDPNEIAHMLHDIRWDEVPRAFSVAINNAARRGPVRPDLGRSFKSLVEYLVLLGFGSTDRAVVQPWFLQNWDFFFVSLLDGLLLLNQKSAILRVKEGAFRRAVAAVLEMIDGARSYMSLDRLGSSTAVHALVVALSQTKGGFLKNGVAQMGGSSLDTDAATRRSITLAHVIFMDEVAGAILDEGKRDVATWDHALGHYVGAEQWRGFAARCRTYLPHGADSVNIRTLEAAVDASVRIAHERAVAHHIASLRDHHAVLQGHAAAMRTEARGKRKAAPKGGPSEVVDLASDYGSDDDADSPDAALSKAFRYQAACWRRGAGAAAAAAAAAAKRPGAMTAAGASSWDSDDDDDGARRQRQRRGPAPAPLPPPPRPLVSSARHHQQPRAVEAAEPPPPHMYAVHAC